MTSGQVIVELRGIAKQWDATARLVPVDLTVHAGDIVVVQGRSGTGKSTLLAVIAGWCEPDDGTLWWDPDLGSDRHRPHRWTELSVVPQILATDDDLLVAENIEIPLRAAGIDREEARARRALVLDQLDLLDLADRWPTELSTGQRQRLAVARAVAARPRLLLADEPTSHQDTAHAGRVMDALRDTAHDGAGVIVTSHDPAVARQATTLVELT